MLDGYIHTAAIPAATLVDAGKHEEIKQSGQAFTLSMNCLISDHCWRQMDLWSLLVQLSPVGDYSTDNY